MRLLFCALAGWISQGAKSSHVCVPARPAFVANCNLFAANGKCGDNSFLAQFQPIKSTRGKNKEAPGRQTTSLPLSLKYCAYKLYKVHGNMQCPLVTGGDFQLRQFGFCIFFLFLVIRVVLRTYSGAHGGRQLRDGMHAPPSCE